MGRTKYKQLFRYTNIQHQLKVCGMQACFIITVIKRSSKTWGKSREINNLFLMKIHNIFIFTALTRMWFLVASQENLIYNFSLAHL